ncbi:head-tail connector protein [Flavobacteriales bacterium]|nr:head-tail connector protein [Flavobacteriales bacterium]
MKLHRTSGTTYTDVISLATAKAHLRVDSSAEDALITSLISTAGEIVEEYTGQYLSSCGFTYYADYFSSVMKIYASPGISITSVKFTDSAGVLQTHSSSEYFTDLKSHPIRVQFENLPTDVDDRVHAVQIAGTAGFTTVPETLKSAMLLILGHLYEHRKDVLVGVQSAPLVHGAKYLMDKFKPSTF